VFSFVSLLSLGREGLQPVGLTQVPFGCVTQDPKHADGVTINALSYMASQAKPVDRLVRVANAHLLINVSTAHGCEG
jgi:hypothetical protein